MIKRYSFPTEEKANELIALLSEENKPTVTTLTHEIVQIGFQNEYEFNEETKESILVKEGKTFDVDIMWKDEALEDFSPFEVFPKTPNHTFI